MSTHALKGSLARRLRFGAGGALAALALTLGCSDPIEKQWQYTSHSASRSSPALAGDLLVFGTEKGEVHAVDTAGAYRWKFSAGKEVISAPAVLQDMLFFGSTNANLYAVDRSGRQIFKYTTFERIKGDPLVVGNTVVFGSYDKHLYKIDIETQKEVWTYPPNIINGRIVKQPPAPDDLEEGEEPPQFDKSQWPTEGFSYAKPLVTSDGLIVQGNLDGHLYAVDDKTGELAWRWVSEGAKKSEPSSGITSSVREHDGVLYFGANDDHVYALKLKDQSLLWKFKTGDEVNSSPAIDEERGQLYIGSRDHKLYALDLKSGAKKWEFSASGPILGIPAIYEDLVVFGGGSGDGHVYALKADDGQEYWKFKTGAEIEADPIFSGDTFFIASADRNLYAFKINKLPGE